MNRVSLLELSRDACLDLRTGSVTRCERLWSWAPPPLEDYDLWVILDGQGSMTLNGRQHRLQPGSLFVLKPGSRIRAQHDPDNRLGVFFQHFELQDSRGKAIPSEQIDWPEFPVQIRDLSTLETCARIVVDSTADANLLGQRRAEVAMWQILLQAESESKAPPASVVDSRIKRVLDAIHNDPGAPWPVGQMATRAGLSRAQFTRLFTRHTGTAPNHYVTRQRIERARVLLRESDLPLAMIVDTLGYRDVYFFNRQFKQWTGTPPGQWRRKARKLSASSET